MLPDQGRSHYVLRGGGGQPVELVGWEWNGGPQPWLIGPLDYADLVRLSADICDGLAMIGAVDTVFPVDVGNDGHVVTLTAGNACLLLRSLAGLISDLQPGAGVP